MRVGQLLLGGALCAATACGVGQAPADGGVRCDARRATGGMCIESLEPRNGTARLSLQVQCRDAGGKVVERCPTERLVGVCEQTLDMSKAWTLNRVSRVHHYLHPDVATPDALAGIADRCPPEVGGWTPAPLPQ
jgi:hypothetical protein